MKSYEITSNSHGPLLRLRAPWRDRLEKILRAQYIKQLELDESSGWRGRNLDFLKQISFLESLYIRDHSKIDVSGVSYLSNLKRLNIHIQSQFSQPVEFQKLKELESCTMGWNPILETVLKSSFLKSLVISDMKRIDILDLRDLINLKRFWVTRAPSLTEIIFSPDNSLVELVLRKLPSLRNVTAWSCMANLKLLWLTECKKLDINPIKMAQELEELDLFNMGEIASLKFIKALPSLKLLRLSGNTQVTDGRLAFILGLAKIKTVVFPPKKHYDLTAIEITQALMLKEFAH